MPNNILITPGSASIQFSGSVGNTIRLQVEPSGSVAFYGNSGSLFGISDSLSGSLMSVNDISGLPILEVFSDDRVVMGTFNRNTLVVTGSRVGIGTTTPNMKLVVVGSSAGVGDANGILTVTDGTGANTDTKINFGVVSNSYGWIQAVKPGTDLRNLILNPQGASVGIGTVSPGSTLHVQGSISGSTTQISSLGVGTGASGTAGEIRATNEVTAYFSSDKRLKENIQPLTDALNKLSRVNGVEFDWTEEHINKRGGEDGYFVRKHDVGIIAQEIKEVLPEVVAERKDGYLAVRYEKIVPLLIEAIKELQAEVAELKRQR